MCSYEQILLLIIIIIESIVNSNKKNIYQMRSFIIVNKICITIEQINLYLFRFIFFCDNLYTN